MPRTKKTQLKTEKKTKTAAKAEAKLSIPVYGVDGKEKGSWPIPEELITEKDNQKLLAQAVRVYLTNQRQGTASSKTRGEVVGSTRKIYRQKGTGNARHGDIKAPIFVGGGVVGGPKPRNFSLQMNKKQTVKSLIHALSLKFKENSILGIDTSFESIEPKTKILAAFLKAINSENDKLMLVLPKLEKNNLLLAARNLKNLSVRQATSLNTYEILRAKKILFAKESLSVLQKIKTKNEN